jgi:hypothetical protein
MMKDKYAYFRALSLDLDNTLVLFDKLSDVGIEILKIADHYGIPLFGSTNRSIYSEIERILNVIKKINENPSLPNNNSKLNYLRFCLNSFIFPSFKNISREISKLGITSPFIFVTPYDYFLSQSQQGKYYQVIDQVTDYIIEKIDKILQKESVTLGELQNQLETMMNIIFEKKDDQSSQLATTKKEVFDDKFPAIEKLLEEEKALRLKYNAECKQNRFQHKDIHFLWIHDQAKCRTIVHLDDFPVIYQYMGKFDKYDLNLSPHVITKSTTQVQVYCFPFDPLFKQEENAAVLDALIEGLNLPIYEAISDLSARQACCWCFFNSNRSATIRAVNYYLNTILVSKNLNKEIEKEEKTTGMRQAKICTSNHKDLCDVIGKIPFAQINKIKDPALVKPFTQIQQELAELRSPSSLESAKYVRLEGKETSISLA